jgi:hypothetical protein
VASLVARNANEAIVAPVVGSGGVCVRREPSQAVGFMEVHLAGIWPSRHEDGFTFNLLHKQIL